MRRAALVLGLLTGASGCGPTVPTLPEVVLASRALVPRSDAAPCTLAGEGDAHAFDTFPMFVDAAGKSEVAQVSNPGLLPLRFSQIPAAAPTGRASSSRAYVTTQGRGVRLVGWIDLRLRSFTLAERIPILHEQLRAEIGTAVNVWGALPDGSLFVSARTPFVSPERVAFAVPCRAVQYGKLQLTPPPAAPRKGSTRHVDGGMIALFEAAEGDRGYAATFRSMQTIGVLEGRGDRVHVIIGEDPVRNDVGTLFAEGWIARDKLVAPPESVDRDSGSILDGVDVCPTTHVLEETEIGLGIAPPGVPIGTLELDALVRVEDRRGDYVAVRMQDEVIGPPRGLKWWIRVATISSSCSEQDGCPCE